MCHYYQLISSCSYTITKYLFVNDKKMNYLIYIIQITDLNIQNHRQVTYHNIYEKMCFIINKLSGEQSTTLMFININ